jgi:hypothetical protein
MATASEGGAWGMAVLACFLINKEQHESLTSYLANKVFKDIEGQKIYPCSEDLNGFTLYMERYKEGLVIEEAAIDHLVENWKK